MIDHLREWRIACPRDLRENAAEIIHWCLVHAGRRIEWETTFIQRRLFKYSPSMFHGFPAHHVEQIIKKYGFRSTEDIGKDHEAEEGAVQMLNVDHLVWFLVDYFQLSEMVVNELLTVGDALVRYRISYDTWK